MMLHDREVDRHRAPFDEGHGQWAKHSSVARAITFKTLNTMTLAQRLLDDITTAHADGRTVIVTTSYKATKVTAATAAMYEASGTRLFKLGKDGNLMMASGRKYNTLTFGEGNYLMVQVTIAD